MPSSKKRIATKTKKSLRFEENSHGEPLGRTMSGNTYSQGRMILEAREQAKKRNKNAIILNPELAATKPILNGKRYEHIWASQGVVDPLIESEYIDTFGDDSYFWTRAEKAAAEAEVAKERAMAAWIKAREAAREATRQAEAHEYCKNGDRGCTIAGGKKTRRHRKK